DVLDLTFNQFLGSASTFNQNTIPGYHTFRYGPLILGYKGENEIAIGSNARLSKKGGDEFQVEGRDIVLHPLRHFMSPEATKENKFSRQILFKES
ncbi:MAG TPA: hypothetical protein VF540_03325, partial [Segetibacter sp.]